MTQPTFRFDRTGAKMFRTALDTKLAEIGKELGINIRSIGTLRFDETEGSFSVRIEATGEETQRTRFANIAPMFGLVAPDFCREYRGDKIIGITSGGRLQVEHNGKTMLYPSRALPRIVATLHPENSQGIRA